jgi:hypothetical protein
VLHKLTPRSEYEIRRYQGNASLQAASIISNLATIDALPLTLEEVSRMPFVDGQFILNAIVANKHKLGIT